MSTAEIIISATLRMSVPIVLGSTAASFSTKAGVVSFGCEGMMATGAFCGALAVYYSNNLLLGVLCAVLGGILISLLHAFLHVSNKVNGTLSGVSVNMLGTAASALVLKVVWKTAGFSPEYRSFVKLTDSGLAKIPWIGSILADQNILFFAAIGIVLVGWLILFKTPFGLRLRMVGENPVAANTVGIHTSAMKYAGVIICGAICGLAGAYLSLARMNRFVLDMTGGRGYVAMVIADLGGANPLIAGAASLLFGFFDCLQSIFQSVDTPSQFWMIMPYLFALCVALVNNKFAHGPAGMGKHFDD